MKRRIGFRGLNRLLISLLFISLLVVPAISQPKSGYKVVGYVRAMRGFDVSTVQAEKLTHINYAFASVINGEIAFRFRSPEQESRLRQTLGKLMELRKLNPSLKILVSVGGWGNCAGFSDAALTPESRLTFARSGVKIMQEYGFDGVDLDWEYPGQIGGNEEFRPEDKENFTLMIKALRDEFTRVGSPGLLTIASGADEEYFRWTNLGDAQEYLDFINIMAYDFYSGLSTISGHHANLYPTDIPGTIRISASIAVDRHIAAGVPAEKLVIGVPFYGRYWKGVPDSRNGLYGQSATTGQYKIYTELLSTYINKNTFTRYWDVTAQAPYLYSKDSAMVITYDDPESLKLKADYVKKRKLGGIMFWEYTADDSGVLLQTIFDGLRTR